MKNTIIFSTITTMFALTATAAVAAPVQWAGTGGNGHWYDFVDGSGFAGDFESAAESSSYLGLAGYLVTITSQAEQDFLNSIWPGPTDADFGNNYAIGISDRSEEGIFRYIGGPEDGQTLSYTNWNPFEPNDFNTGEDYVLGWWENSASGGWNDANFASGGYVVEYSAVSEVPLAGALPLAASAFALLGAIGFRRKRSSS